LAALRLKIHSMTALVSVIPLVIVIPIGEGFVDVDEGFSLRASFRWRSGWRFLLCFWGVKRVSFFQLRRISVDARADAYGMLSGDATFVLGSEFEIDDLCAREPCADVRLAVFLLDDRHHPLFRTVRP
jgi:hypothetical protein